MIRQIMSCRNLVGNGRRRCWQEISAEETFFVGMGDRMAAAHP